MHHSVQIAGTACLVFVTCVQAQTSASVPSAAAVPERMPYDIPYGSPIGLDAAKHLLALAEAEARKHDWKMNIAVVDPHGDLVAFERMDGAQYASVEVSQNKARTSARFRRETRVFFNQFESGHAYVATLEPGLVASPGGFPLVEDGKVIGAIGCSGGTGDQDAVTCKAAAATVK
ncbi:heme-binding protein [Paraburkholderia silvatlantica]|uniref:GlcG/HbpS family heme-binding protein n=1 Tax=Paraburkholderia silvatlantica TaxID=321895 RepID=UPI003751AD0C